MLAGMDQRHAAVVTWRVDLVVNDAARHVWGASTTLTLHKRAGESRDHIVLKLIGAALLLADDVEVVVEPPVRVVGHRPDVVSSRLGEIVGWVECGDVAVDKLDRITRALGEFVVVTALKKGKTAAQGLARAVAHIARPQRVRVLGLHADAVDAIGTALNRQVRSSVVVTINDVVDDTTRIDVAVDDTAIVLEASRASA
ncbi:MAG TPA: YaeQ family protein [Myxococcota bacterium]